MIYTSYYLSPVGKLLLASEDDKLIGLWIEEQKYYPNDLKTTPKEDEIIVKYKKWLDSYFNGEKPEINQKDLNPKGSEFRKKVWKMLCEIPYGETATYSEIAGKISDKMSAQAVGGAVGHNPISIIIPCHRVIGADGSLTGYAGGVENKKKLLEMEKKQNNNST